MQQDYSVGETVQFWDDDNDCCGECVVTGMAKVGAGVLYTGKRGESHLIAFQHRDHENRHTAHLFIAGKKTMEAAIPLLENLIELLKEEVK